MKRPCSSHRRTASRHPLIEALEDRRLLAVITVNTASDTSDPTGATLSLREALEVSNGTLAVTALSTQAQAQVSGALSSPNTIDFDIPGSGVQTITVNSPLPTVTQPVTIDGYTQPGASANTNGPGLGDNAVLAIQLVPSATVAAGSEGLVITAGGSTVRGLVINGFTTAIDLQTAGGNTVAGNYIGTTPDGSALGTPAGLTVGILLQSSNNTIGGTAPGDRNVISGVLEAGVQVPLDPVSDASNNVIEGNFIGTDAAGTQGLPGPTDFQTEGVLIQSGLSDTIGGTAPGAGNLLTGNAAGIFIELGGVNFSATRNSNGGHVIEGNLIGTDLTGTVVPTDIGVNRKGNPDDDIAVVSDAIVSSSYTAAPVNPLPITIGGSDPSAGNVLAGSGDTGIKLSYPTGFTAPTLIQGNFIGTDRSGTENLGNAQGGIRLLSLFTAPTNVTIEDNTIAYNEFGVISDAAGETGNLIVDNSIYQNSIYQNEEGGIGVGAGGPAPPTLTSDATAGGTTTVQGTVSGAPGAVIQVDLYANPNTISDEDIGEAQTHVQALDVTIGASGTQAFTSSFPTPSIGTVFGATATDASDTTSDVSSYVYPPLAAPALALTGDVATTAEVGSVFEYTFTVQNNGTAAATGVNLSTPVPTGTTFSSSSGGILAGGVVTFDIGTLAPGASVTETMDVNFDTTDTQVTASVNPGDNTFQTRVQAPEVDGTLTGSAPATATVGQTLTYTFTAAFTGSDNESNSFILTDTLPAGLTFVSSSPDPTTNSNGVLTFDLTSALVGIAPATVTINVTPTATGMITNQAAIVFSAESGSVEKDASQTTTVSPAAAQGADLTLPSATATPTVPPGGQVTYTTEVHNAGPDDAQDVVGTILVPAHTSFVSFTAPQGVTVNAPPAGTEGPATITTNAPTVQSGQSEDFTLVVQVDDDTPGGTMIASTASVTSSTPDPSATNNSVSASTTVTSATPSATTTASPTPTPALTTPSSVTITLFQVEKVKLGAVHHAKKALVLFVQFSGALSTAAAQNLTAYTVFSGKLKKVHKVSEAIYNKLVPLTQAIYNASGNSVILLPRGKHKLAKLEQLQVNVSVLTDAQERPINFGKNFTATVTNKGLVISDN